MKDYYLFTTSSWMDTIANLNRISLFGMRVASVAKVVMCSANACMFLCDNSFSLCFVIESSC